MTSETELDWCLIASHSNDDGMLDWGGGEITDEPKLMNMVRFEADSISYRPRTIAQPIRVE